MAQMTYQQFLAARGRRGTSTASTPATAAAFKLWQSRQPEFQAQQAANAQPTTPTGVSTAMTPQDYADYLAKDPAAMQALANAGLTYKTGGADALAAWQNQKDQLAAQLPQYQHALEMGQRQAMQAGAARGTAQSGETELERQQAQTDYANQVAGNQRQSQQVDTDYQRGAGQLASDYNQSVTGAYAGSAQRALQNRLDNFNQTYGVGSGTGANIPDATNVANAVGPPTQVQVPTVGPYAKPTPPAPVPPAPPTLSANAAATKVAQGVSGIAGRISKLRRYA